MLMIFSSPQLFESSCVVLHVQDTSCGGGTQPPYMYSNNHFTDPSQHEPNCRPHSSCVSYTEPSSLTEQFPSPPTYDTSQIPQQGVGHVPARACEAQEVLGTPGRPGPPQASMENSPSTGGDVKEDLFILGGMFDNKNINLVGFLRTLPSHTLNWGTLQWMPKIAMFPTVLLIVELIRIPSCLPY